MIYLDNASTTPIDPAVFEAMLPYLKEQYGNPGSLYSIGREAHKAVEKAREQTAAFIGAEPHQIIFTSGGTEANNTVFFGLSEQFNRKGKRHIITSAAEHDSVLKAVREMCIKHGFYKTETGIDAQGCAVPGLVKDAINIATGIVSVMYVNNETGAENDIFAISDICRTKGVLFHTDCVQAAGSCPIDVRQIGCDFLSLSSHKIYAPKGCGALFIKRPDEISPLIHGGSNQEFGLRGGTENVAAIVGFGKACELMGSRLHSADILTSSLKQVFWQALCEALTSAELSDTVHINGGSPVKHGRILNLRFDGVDGETLVLMLDHKGVCVSAGSACRSHESEPSRVLTAMGLTPEEARSSIRVSFSCFNTEAETIEAAKTIAACAALLRHSVPGRK